MPIARHNFFLSPFNEHFYPDGFDPSLMASVEQKLANQDQLYSTVLAAIRDDFNKGNKIGQVIKWFQFKTQLMFQSLELKMAPTTKKRHYHNNFDVLAGGGLGR